MLGARYRQSSTNQLVMQFLLSTFPVGLISWPLWFQRGLGNRRMHNWHMLEWLVPKIDNQLKHWLDEIFKPNGAQYFDKKKKNNGWLTRMELRYKIVARFTKLPAATACWLVKEITIKWISWLKRSFSQNEVIKSKQWL